jgi:predicted dehydrogenase
MTSSLHRRYFLFGSLAATAIASGRIRAQSPSERLEVALIAAGGRAGSHADEWSKDKRVNIRYVVDPDEAQAGKMIESIGKRNSQKEAPRLLTDMRKAIDDPNVNFISTATPNHWHALVGIWAMQAGKDAYIEKPVSHNISEGTSLIAAARKYKRMCQVGTQCRSSRAIREAFEFMRGGGIGDVRFARGLCYKRRAAIGALGNYQIPPTVDFNLWSGPAPLTNPNLTRPKFHYDWHWQRLYGNGDSGNQGPHQTDIARWGLGLDRHPQRVITYGGRLGYQAEKKDEGYIDAGDTPNTEVSVFDYGDKCIVFETRGLSVDDSGDEELNRLFESKSGNKVGVVFYGSEGYLVQQQYDQCTAFDKDFQTIKVFKGMDNHFQNFVDACVSRKVEDLNADVREGHLSASLAHLGNISYYLGESFRASPEEIKKALANIKSLDDNDATVDRTVAHLLKNGVDLQKYPLSLGPLLKFDPEQEIFPESKEATALCSREYRTGFVVPTPDKV